MDKFYFISPASEKCIFIHFLFVEKAQPVTDIMRYVTLAHSLVPSLSPYFFLPAFHRTDAESSSSFKKENKGWTKQKNADQLKYLTKR